MTWRQTLSAGSRPSVTDIREDLLAIYHAGLAAVDGHAAVSRYLNANPPSGTIHLAAIGKAACAMAAGAREVLGEQLGQALVITKTGHLDPVLQQDPRFVCREAGHPVPTDDSLAAGHALIRFLEELPNDGELLVLISGGASSLVEVLPENVGLDRLRALTDWLLSSGLPIHDMNRVRCAFSRIKGGRLLHWIGSRPTTVLLISDVAGDDPAFIGSGLLYTAGRKSLDHLELPDWVTSIIGTTQGEPVPDSGELSVEHHVVARLVDALEAAHRHAGSIGYTPTIVTHALSGDALEAGRDIVNQLQDKQAGAYLWGGETTVNLPPRPGRGGRCQSLALSAACSLAGRDNIVLLAAGTDGTDGPGTAAGAMVDGGTLERGAAHGLGADRCLQQADAGTFLEASGDLVITGPTGTNVTDLVIAIKIE
jgi:hydroxypyruvate reductase